MTLAREGADIVMVDIDENIDSVPYDLATADQLEQTRAEVEALGVRVIAARADVRHQDQLDAVVTQAEEEFGGVDICIANAGIWSIAPFWEMHEQQWQDMVDINLSGVWRTAKAATASMIERGGGAIVLISSVNGIEPNADFAHYTSAKSGVIGLMMAIAFEGGPHNIRCNAICPGVVDTPMNDWQGPTICSRASPVALVRIAPTSSALTSVRTSTASATSSAPWRSWRRLGPSSKRWVGGWSLRRRTFAAVSSLPPSSVRVWRNWAGWT
jgi:NAD(P)-dependent dehydrogenase (short-subunit alcohol dehydrogenase family)